MSKHRESIWTRAYIRRGDDMDVVNEIECDSPASASRLADELWARRIYDRVEATIECLGSTAQPVQRLVCYDHASAPAARAPADFETLIPQAFGVRPERKPQA